MSDYYDIGPVVLDSAPKLIRPIEWSPEQNAVFRSAIEDTANLAIDSRPGSGKTTTAVELVKRYTMTHYDHSVLVCAYSNTIRDELANRLAGFEKITVKGSHQIGFALVRSAWRDIQVDKDKGKSYARWALDQEQWFQRLDGRDKIEWTRRVYALASYTKNTLATHPDHLKFIADLFELWDPNHQLDKLIEMAMKSLDLSISDTSRCDFDDMLWLPIRWEIMPRWRYDLVVIDEGQDYTEAQLWLAQRMCKDNGRIVTFADRNQAIYGFRGAFPETFDRLMTSINAKYIPMTTSYRCPKSVVREAAQIVPDFNAPDWADEGAVDTIKLSDIRPVPGDVVISRTNAHLAQVALAVARARVPVHVIGRDIGAMLVRLIDRSKAKTVDELAAWARSTKEALVLEYEAQGNSRRAYAVADDYDTLTNLSRSAGSVDELRSLVASLFVDEPSSRSVVCSTIHKFKGKENDTVYLLMCSFTRPPSSEEARIRYVGITRAKKRLVYVV